MHEHKDADLDALIDAQMTPNAELSGPMPLAAEGSRSNDVLERGGKGD